MEKKEIEDSNIISAEYIAQSATAWYLDCEGDKVWFPKDKVNFDRETMELEAPRWMLRSKFPNEGF